MKVYDTLPMRLRAAYLTMHRRAQGKLAAHGVTPDQSIVLRLLDESPGLTQAELGVLSYSDPSTMTAMLGLLEKRELVQRVRDERDGRARRVYLTPAGRAKARRLMAISIDAHQRMLAALGPRNRKALLRALEQLAEMDAAEALARSA